MVRLYLGFCQLITMTPAQGVGCILLCSLLLWSGCDHESTAVRFTSSHESDAITTKATLVSDDDAENFALISELKQLTIEDQQGANNLRSMS
ncbi:MAG: hypothetical protein OXC40_00875, partial [Proteobacteria bacterium]|nr:hypothetical protein [Pseudomonadota bacterium]